MEPFDVAPRSRRVAPQPSWRFAGVVMAMPVIAIGAAWAAGPAHGSAAEPAAPTPTGFAPVSTVLALPPTVSASTAAAVTTTTVACANTYTVQQGDYWLRIAEAASLDLAALLDLNGATSTTALFPGQQLCLPAGATVVTVSPTTATTATPASTAAPARPTAPATTAPAATPHTTSASSG